MAFTYDLATDRGRVRLLLADTSASNYKFEDAEIDAFIALAQTNVYAAAATGYGVIIRDKARLAKVIVREGYRSEEFAIAELKELIADLEKKAITAGGLAFGDFSPTDDMFESFRPGWRSDTDVIVE